MLAAACLRVPEDPDPWSWLGENAVSGKALCAVPHEKRNDVLNSESLRLDFVIGDKNAMVVAWRLLEGLLNAYEEPKSTRLHKAIASKIMSLDFVLPYWLESSYKVSPLLYDTIDGGGRTVADLVRKFPQTRSPPELFRLYLMHGNLNEASKLLSEYIAAMLGKGKELFGLEHSLGVTSPPLYFPVNAVDTLLHELEYHQVVYLPTFSG